MAFEVTATYEEPAYDHRSRVKSSVDKAERYRHRPASKHSAEMVLVRRGLALVNGVDSVLDAPCGVGRATIMLAQMGYHATGADLGEGAIRLARLEVAQAGVPAIIDTQDLVRTSYRDRQFDAVLCFRFFHHLPTPEFRDEIVRELCRVAGQYVLISYLSPWSPTSAKRWLRKRLGLGRPSVQQATSLTEVQGYFARHGFHLVDDLAQMPFLHSLHLAVFRRAD